ncbi:anti-sigma factor family protein [Pedobacter sp. ASV12]|uniref:anti-sigma factor family protein n=1 Tax=Pedobacter sp. ASV12 TaxID=2795120 RepID=UPI0018ECADE3|nr:hypothetical protein [Pedobacter sp. ASV12]
MNTIEEQLWNYIDNNCTSEERATVEARLALDKTYQQVYQELLAVHHELSMLELDEPSMSFTRNVMEQVKLEPRPIALKTKVDQRIIGFIGAFFVLSILAVFILAIANSKTSFDFSIPKFNWDLGAGKLANPTVLNVFLLVDLVLALIYIDSMLRKKRAQKKGV